MNVMCVGGSNSGRHLDIPDSYNSYVLEHREDIEKHVCNPRREEYRRWDFFAGGIVIIVFGLAGMTPAEIMTELIDGYRKG